MAAKLPCEDTPMRQLLRVANHHKLSKATGVPQSTLYRYAHGRQRSLRSDYMDPLRKFYRDLVEKL